MVVGQADKVHALEHRFQLPSEMSRIVGTHPETHQGADVAQNGVPNLPFELRQVLVRQNERHPVLPEFGQHGGQPSPMLLDLARPR